MKETIVKINKTKSWFFLPDSSRKKREESNQQNYKLKRNERNNSKD